MQSYAQPPTCFFVGRIARRGARRPAIGGGALVNTEKQKINPKANKLSKRDALQNDKSSYQSFQ